MSVVSTLCLHVFNALSHREKGNSACMKIASFLSVAPAEVR